MPYSKLTRDADYVLRAIRQVGDKLIAVKDLKIVIPYRFIQGKLAMVSSNIKTLAVFAIVVDNKYAVSNVCSSMTITPSNTNIVTGGVEDHFEFSFDAGSVICPNINLIVDDINSYNIYNEMIAKGNVPWYLSYEDFGKVLMTAHRYAGINLTGNNAPIELIITSIARKEGNLYKYYRNTIKTAAQQYTTKPAYVPFNSVAYGATNSVGKIMGSYFEEGMTSTLTVDDVGPPGVEAYLRK